MANISRAVGSLALGNPASYRRVLSAVDWSGPELGCPLTRFLLTHLVPGGPVDRVGDDSVDGHPGPTVGGNGRHRDAVRSSHPFTAWRSGHTGVVPAVLVTCPFAASRWALTEMTPLHEYVDLLACGLLDAAGRPATVYRTAGATAGGRERDDAGSGTIPLPPADDLPAVGLFDGHGL